MRQSALGSTQKTSFKCNISINIYTHLLSPKLGSQAVPGHRRTPPPPLVILTVSLDNCRGLHTAPYCRLMQPVHTLPLGGDRCAMIKTRKHVRHHDLRCSSSICDGCSLVQVDANVDFDSSIQIWGTSTITWGIFSLWPLQMSSEDNNRFGRKYRDPSYPGARSPMSRGVSRC